MKIKKLVKVRSKESKEGTSNLIAMFSYLIEILFIIGIAINVIILLVGDKRDKYLRFHVIQSILFAIGSWFIAVLLFVSIIGILLLFPFAIIIFILWLVLMYKALVGQKFKLPVIGDYAEQHA